MIKTKPSTPELSKDFQRLKREKVNHARAKRLDAERLDALRADTKSLSDGLSDVSQALAKLQGYAGFELMPENRREIITRSYSTLGGFADVFRNYIIPAIIKAEENVATNN